MGIAVGGVGGGGSEPPAAPVETSVFGRTGAIVAMLGDYAASLISAVAHGTTAALTVQGQLDELTDEKADKSLAVATTAPLSGGGDLSSALSLTVSSFAGDGGSGGARGVVPAPAAGDGAAGKYLAAGGGWSVPQTGGGAHAATHVTGGGDTIAGAVAGGNAGLLTGADKTKLDGIAAGAEVNVNADWNSGAGDSLIQNKPTLGTASPLNVAASGDAAAGEVVKGNDTRLTNARTPTTHTHAIADTTGLQGALDSKATTSHNHDAAYAAVGHAHAGTYEPAGTVATHAAAADPHTGYQRESERGAVNGYASLGADGKVPTAQLPAAGSDPWTYVKLAADFSTLNAVAADVGLAFTPLANLSYEVEAVLFTRTATATVGPRPGLAWPTGLTDGVAFIQQTSAAGTNVLANGNITAALLAPAGGVPTTTGSWPAFISAVFVAGASPSGTLRVQLASETAATNVTVKAGSYLKYRAY